MIDVTSFTREAGSAFEFVRSEFGYNLVLSEGYELRYEHGERFVVVAYDAARSHELTLWVGDIGDGEPPLELADVLRASQCPEDDVDAVALMQTSDEFVLARLLGQAASALRACGSALLKGDAEAFGGAKRLRSQRAAEYTREINNRGILDEADCAWRARDYPRVRELLAPIRDSLSRTHAKRLEYVETKL